MHGVVELDLPQEPGAPRPSPQRMPPTPYSGRQVQERGAPEKVAGIVAYSVCSSTLLVRPKLSSWSPLAYKSPPASWVADTAQAV